MTDTFAAVTEIPGFERHSDPWGDVEHHVLEYGAGGFFPSLIDHASGCHLYTEYGKDILDFTSGQMSATLGHAHPDIVHTVQTAYPRLDHLFSGMLSRPVVNLARTIAETAQAVPDIDGDTVDPLTKVLLLSTGSEVNEAALRLAKLVTGKFEVVSFSRSWHGMTGASAGATYSSARHGGAPVIPGQLVIPTPYEYRPDFVDADGHFDWRRQLDFGFEMVDAQSVGSLAACIVEPILSSGGVLVPPPGYLKALRDKCHERGMLLILDEAQTGMGRTGSWFEFQHEGVTPDILTMSKTLGAGLPLAAMVTTDALAAQSEQSGFVFFTSHVSDPMVASVGCTVIQVVERDRLLEAANVRGEQLHAGLVEIMQRHSIVGDVRGRGLLQGIEIVEDRASKRQSERLGIAITQECYRLGLHMNVVSLPGMGGVFRIAPPLTVTAAEVSLGLERLDEAVTRVESTLA